MADGWATLGAALGGDSEVEYQKGLALGARTQNALAQARERVEKAKAQEGLATELEAAGIPTTAARASASALTAGAGLGDVLGMLGKQQEQGFRATMGSADPNVDVATRNRAAFGLVNGPQATLGAVGSRGYQDIMDPTKGVMPLGDAITGGASGGNPASAIQVLQAFGMLDANGRVKPGMEKQAFDVMRTTQRVFDEGGVPAVTNANPFATGAPAPLGSALAPAPGTAPAAAPAPLGAVVAPPAPPVTPLSTVQRVAGNTATIAGANKEAALRAEKGVALPAVQSQLADFRKNVGDLMLQPGFDAIYGSIAGTGPALMARTLVDQDAANAEAARTQIDAKSFGIAIQSMRGLGQLSNAEGLKVQQAFTRATNPRISPEEARLAWDEALVHLDELERVAQMEAKPPAVAPGAAAGAAPVQIQDDAGYDALDSGTQFVGPDGITRTKP